MRRRITGYLRHHHLGLIAIFIALGGTTYAATAARNSVTSKSIKNGQIKLADLGPGSVESSKVVDDALTGTDIRESTLSGIEGPVGQTGPPGEQGPAGSPDTGAQILAKLSSVDGAGSGLDADTLDGQGSNSFAPVGSESLHVVGTAGNPSFQGCANDGSWAPDSSAPPAFFRDPAGVVHLQGKVFCLGGPPATAPTIFTLPAGYRPSLPQSHLVPEGSATSGSTNLVTVSDTTGAVAMADLAANLVSNGFVGLDGITFRCGPSGANGCP